MDGQVERACSSYDSKEAIVKSTIKCLSVERPRQSQSGATVVEFSIVALSVMLVALFSLQIGLLYHAKTVLNYAVFEAARTGAVNNASMDAMRTELGLRLAPLQGGDGSRGKALEAGVSSSLKVLDPFNTQIAVLNPTLSAFDDWAVDDPDSGERFIPVNQLRHQSYDIGQQSGLSLRDATLLKIQVTHGVDLHVPVAGKLLVNAMRWIDIGNAQYYLRGKWPVKAVATVRMQSDSFESEIRQSASVEQTSDGDLDIAQAPTLPGPSPSPSPDSTPDGTDIAQVDELQDGPTIDCGPEHVNVAALASVQSDIPGSTSTNTGRLVTTSEYRELLAEAGIEGY